MDLSFIFWFSFSSLCSWLVPLLVSLCLLTTPAPPLASEWALYRCPIWKLRLVLATLRMLVPGSNPSPAIWTSMPPKGTCLKMEILFVFVYFSTAIVTHKCVCQQRSRIFASLDALAPDLMNFKEFYFHVAMAQGAHLGEIGLLFGKHWPNFDIIVKKQSPGSSLLIYNSRLGLIMKIRLTTSIEDLRTSLTFQTTVSNHIDPQCLTLRTWQILRDLSSGNNSYFWNSSTKINLSPL